MILEYSILERHKRMSTHFKLRISSTPKYDTFKKKFGESLCFILVTYWSMNVGYLQEHEVGYLQEHEGLKDKVLQQKPALSCVTA